MGLKKRKKLYKRYTKCRFCFSQNIQHVINLGKVPLAGGFLKKKNFKKEKKYPLELVFCNNCYLLQCSTSVSPEILFKKYYYFSSSIKTLVDHFEYTASQIYKNLKNNGNFIFEIGCNDGAFLNACKELGYKALGIDPAVNIVKPLIKKGVPIINNFFSEKTAKFIVKKYQRADAIYAFHSLAHIEDMHNVVKGIKFLLKTEGFLYLEAHYLGDLLDMKQYDMIYHEHQYYYSLSSLIKFFKQYDMEIFDIKRSRTRAGSIGFFIQNKKTGGRKINQKVIRLIKEEKKKGFLKKTTYINFSKKITKNREDLRNLLNNIKKKKKTIAGYGASGRGTVISNYCGLDSRYLSFVADDASSKQGLYTPGNHLLIKQSSALVDNKINYAVLFAWPFLKEVKKRNKEFISNGGKFILPLPKVKIL